MVLHTYRIQHPILNRQYGAECKMNPPAFGELSINIINKCKEMAKEVAIKKNMNYEEMIHTLNGDVINHNEQC